jgi:hypothetical protein
MYLPPVIPPGVVAGFQQQIFTDGSTSLFIRSNSGGGTYTNAMQFMAYEGCFYQLTVQFIVTETTTRRLKSRSRFRDL